MPKFSISLIVVIVLDFGTQFYQSAPAGHMAVATLFGDVRPRSFEA